MGKNVVIRKPLIYERPNNNPNNEVKVSLFAYFQFFNVSLLSALCLSVCPFVRRFSGN
jgi:hypothetical protein